MPTASPFSWGPTDPSSLEAGVVDREPSVPGPTDCKSSLNSGLHDQLQLIVGEGDGLRHGFPSDWDFQTGGPSPDIPFHYVQRDIWGWSLCRRFSRLHTVAEQQRLPGRRAR